MDPFAQLQDRYRGVLVGSACGDALGATVEFVERRQIAAEFGVLRDIIGGGWLKLPAGGVTDDTQMALCIARSLVERGAFDPHDIAARFVDWYRSEPPDIGNTTRDALRRLDEGTPWTEAGALAAAAMAPRDASNGSIMRCAPVALLARGNPRSNRAWSADSSRITHANRLCVDGCVALNAAIATLLDDPGADVLVVAIAAADELETREALEAAPAQAAATIDAGGYVLATLQAAFWSFLGATSPEEAIVNGVNLGDDADSTGAVAGALAGAKWGYAALPQRWLDVVEHHDELLDLADKLLELNLSQIPERH